MNQKEQYSLIILHHFLNHPKQIPSPHLIVKFWTKKNNTALKSLTLTNVQTSTYKIILLLRILSIILEPYHFPHQKIIIAPHRQQVHNTMMLDTINIAPPPILFTSILVNMQKHSTPYFIGLFSLHCAWIYKSWRDFIETFPHSSMPIIYVTYMTVKFNYCMHFLLHSMFYVIDMT